MGRVLRRPERRDGGRMFKLGGEAGRRGALVLFAALLGGAPAFAGFGDYMAEAGVSAGFEVPVVGLAAYLLLDNYEVTRGVYGAQGYAALAIAGTAYPVAASYGAYFIGEKRNPSRNKAAAFWWPTAASFAGTYTYAGVICAKGRIWGDRNGKYLVFADALTKPFIVAGVYELVKEPLSAAPPKPKGPPSPFAEYAAGLGLELGTAGVGVGVETLYDSFDDEKGVGLPDVERWGGYTLIAAAPFMAALGPYIVGESYQPSANRGAALLWSAAAAYAEAAAAGLVVGASYVAASTSENSVWVLVTMGAVGADVFTAPLITRAVYHKVKRPALDSGTGRREGSPTFAPSLVYTIDSGRNAVPLYGFTAYF